MQESVGQTKAKSLMREHRWEDAISVLINDGLENPKDPWTVMYLGSCFYELQRYSDAIKHYEHAAKLHPTEPTPIGLQGDALLCLGEDDKAKVKYLAALQMDPDDELAIKNWERFQKICKGEPLPPPASSF